MTVAEFRKLCAEYAYEQVERQREQFKRLGVRADWDNPYITLEPAYEAQQIKVFGDMAKKGYIYKGQNQFTGLQRSESALAEAEMNIKIKISIYLRSIPVKDGKNVLEGDESTSFGQRHLGHYLQT